MRSRIAIEAEREKLHEIFGELMEQKNASKAAMIHTALTALEWALSDDFRPVSELQCFQPKNNPKIFLDSRTIP